MHNLFLQTQLGKNLSETNISQLFSEASTTNAWQRVIFKLSRELDKIPASYQIDEYLVPGCDTNVWMVYQEIEGHIYFMAGADSRIIKGLLAIVLTPLNGISLSEYSAFAQNVYLGELPLSAHLTPSESASLRAIEDEVSTIFQGLNF